MFNINIPFQIATAVINAVGPFNAGILYTDADCLIRISKNYAIGLLTNGGIVYIHEGITGARELNLKSLCAGSQSLFTEPKE